MRWLMALLMISGCGTTKIVQYQPPMRVSEAPPPRVDLGDVSKPFQRDAMYMADHLDQQPAPAAKDARAVLGDANRDAEDDVEEGGNEGYTYVYAYDPDREFDVYGCYMETVRIQLAVGEQFHSDGRRVIAKGWSYSTTKTGDNHGNIVEVLLLQQVAQRPGTQHAWWTTNVGQYGIKLQAGEPEETKCMRSIRFRHPQRELNQLIADRQQREEIKAQGVSDGGCTSANYEIEVKEGSPRWVPTIVWRTCEGDHARVHIQFRGDVAWRRIPALKSDGGVVDYRYVPEDHVMVVDGLFNRAVLSLGSRETGYEKVEIHALKEPR